MEVPFNQSVSKKCTCHLTCFFLNKCNEVSFGAVGLYMSTMRVFPCPQLQFPVPFSWHWKSFCCHFFQLLPKEERNTSAFIALVRWTTSASPFFSVRFNMFYLKIFTCSLFRYSLNKEQWIIWIFAEILNYNSKTFHRNFIIISFLYKGSLCVGGLLYWANWTHGPWSMQGIWETYLPWKGRKILYILNIVWMRVIKLTFISVMVIVQVEN